MRSVRQPRSTDCFDNTSCSRRRFLCRGSGIVTAAMAAGAITTLKPWLGGKDSIARADEIGPLGDEARADASLSLRETVAQAERNAPLVQHPCNGNEALYNVRQFQTGNTWRHCLSSNT